MPIKCVVAVSGGKDSQACLKLALTRFRADETIGLFCDTRFEHPLTYAHIDRMRELYGVEIRTICNGSVPEEIVKYRKFPRGNTRFCTYNLKIAPSRDFYAALAQEQGCGFEVWVGVRSDESVNRAKRYAAVISDETMPMHEFMRGGYPKTLHAAGVSCRLPILDWSRADVMDYLAGEENPLYSLGFDRVGCFPCLAAGDQHKEKAFYFDETGRANFMTARALEPIVGRSVFTSRGGQLRNDAPQLDFQGCSICAI